MLKNLPLTFYCQIASLVGIRDTCCVLRTHYVWAIKRKGRGDIVMNDHALEACFDFEEG